MSASPIYHANSRVDWGDTNLDAVGWRAFLVHTVGIYHNFLAEELIIINNARTIKQTSAIAPSEHADSHALGVVLSLRDLAPRASWRAFRVNRKATSVL